MSHRPVLAFFAVLACAALLGNPASAAAGKAAAGQGKVLFERHCTRCHGTKIFHPGKKVDSLEGLRRQVARCDRAIHTGWSKTQKAAVVEYLNSNFYHFP